MKNIYSSLLVGLFLIPTVLFSQTYTLAGTVTRHNGDPVDGVEISYFGSTVITGQDGNYAFPDAPTGYINLTAQGEFEKFEDVTVLDVIVQSQHILSINNLNFWQELEAEVNGTESITAYDLVLVIQLALHMDDGVLPDYEFCFDDGVDLCSDEASFINVVSDTVIIRDFKAIKRGDLAVSSDYMPAPPEAPSPTLYISKEDFQVGEDVSFEVTVDDFAGILGIQQTFEWDSNLLEFQSISGHSDYTPHFNNQVTASGKLPAILASSFPSSANLSNGEVLYTINFKALDNSPSDGYSLEISDELTPPQLVWWDELNNELFIVDGEYLNGENPNAVISVFENIEFEIFPNPTQDYLRTHVKLNNTENFEVRIVNGLGQKIYSKKFNEKILKLDVDVRDYPKGIYFLSLQSENNVKTKSFFKK